MDRKRTVFEYNSMCADLKGGILSKKVDTEELTRTLCGIGKDGWELDRTLFTQDGGTTVSAVIISRREKGTVKKFEYSVTGIVLEGPIARKQVNISEFDNTLNNMAEEGWELGETIYTQAFGATSTMVAIFKRELI